MHRARQSSSPRGFGGKLAGGRGHKRGQAEDTKQNRHRTIQKEASVIPKRRKRNILSSYHVPGHVLGVQSTKTDTACP